MSNQEMFDYSSPQKLKRIRDIVNNKCTRVGAINRNQYKEDVLTTRPFCDNYVIEMLGPRVIDDIINYFKICLEIKNFKDFLMLCGEYPEDYLCVILNDAMEHYRNLKFPPKNVEDYLKRNIEKFIKRYTDYTDSIESH